MVLTKVPSSSFLEKQFFWEIDSKLCIFPRSLKYLIVIGVDQDYYPLLFKALKGTPPILDIMFSLLLERFAMQPGGQSCIPSSVAF